MFFSCSKSLQLFLDIFKSLSDLGCTGSSKVAMCSTSIFETLEHPGNFSTFQNFNSFFLVRYFMFLLVSFVFAEVYMFMVVSCVLHMFCRFVAVFRLSHVVFKLVFLFSCRKGRQTDEQNDRQVFAIRNEVFLSENNRE